MLNTITWMLFPAALNNFPLPCPSWGSCTMSWLQALSWVKNKLAKRVIFNLAQSLLGVTARLPGLSRGCGGAGGGKKEVLGELRAL